MGSFFFFFFFFFKKLMGYNVCGCGCDVGRRRGEGRD